MFPKRISAEHKDLIHDVAYDYYGLRMATCSSDQSVKVWDIGDDKEWYCSAEWKTHSGSVWRVQWAHPEFGQVLATCSIDRSAAIWEEIVESGGDKRKTMWVRRATHVDSKTPVMDIKFAPRHLGLQLATCSQDGIVRIYEASDVMKLSQWNVHPEIMTKLGELSCLSWSTSRLHSPLIAVGSDGTMAGEPKVQIHQYSDSGRKWTRIEAFASVTEPVHDVAFAPSMGRSFHLLAIATKDILIYRMDTVQDESEIAPGASPYRTTVLATIDDHKLQVWRVSWNLTGTVLASSGDDGNVRLFQSTYTGKWEAVGQLKGESAKYKSNTSTALAASPAPAPLSGGGPSGAFHIAGGSSKRGTSSWVSSQSSRVPRDI